MLNAWFPSADRVSASDQKSALVNTKTSPSGSMVYWGKHNYVLVLRDDVRC